MSITSRCLTKQFFQNVCHACFRPAGVLCMNKDCSTQRLKTWMKLKWQFHHIEPFFYTVSQLQLRCQLTTCINRKYVFCDIHFFKNYFELLIMGLVLKSGFPVTVTQDSIDSILSFLQALTLYSF